MTDFDAQLHDSERELVIGNKQFWVMRVLCLIVAKTFIQSRQVRVYAARLFFISMVLTMK